MLPLFLYLSIEHMLVSSFDIKTSAVGSIMKPQELSDEEVDPCIVITTSNFLVVEFSSSTHMHTHTVQVYARLMVQLHSEL